ncbi:MAG: hypothetical protein WDN08_04835 [Rhizomicrobium sp.]
MQAHGFVTGSTTRVIGAAMPVRNPNSSSVQVPCPFVPCVSFIPRADAGLRELGLVRAGAVGSACGASR